MLAQEIIRAKRDGQALSEAQIQSFVKGLTDGSWSEGQVAALGMAVFLRGMGREESVHLTRAMMHSGRVMQWPDMPGPVLDKHSSGGVGDKVSLMLAPMVAACGGYVPMIAGRGLGHTGGTVDKLESIAGYQTRPEAVLFDATVRRLGCAIIGQTADLAPADKRFYATRDVTATVESVPLITASILMHRLRRLRRRLRRDHGQDGLPQGPDQLHNRTQSFRAEDPPDAPAPDRLRARPGGHD